MRIRTIILLLIFVAGLGISIYGMQCYDDRTILAKANRNVAIVQGRTPKDLPTNYSMYAALVFGGCIVLTLILWVAAREVRVEDKGKKIRRLEKELEALKG